MLNVAKTIISKLSVSPQRKVMVAAYIGPKEREKRDFMKLIKMKKSWMT